MGKATLRSPVSCRNVMSETFVPNMCIMEKRSVGSTVISRVCFCLCVPSFQYEVVCSDVRVIGVSAVSRESLCRPIVLT